MATIVDTIFLPDGTPASGLEITFSRQNPSASSQGVILAGEVTVVLDQSGHFSQEIGLGLWKVTLPVRGDFFFEVTDTTPSPSTLAALSWSTVQENTPEADKWLRMKKAANYYSRYRPFVERLYLPGGQSDYQIENCLRVTYCDCGTGSSVEGWTAQEMLTKSEDDVSSGWVFYNGKLFINPEPDSSVNVITVVERYHAADELTRTFPTVPRGDLWMIEDLAEASQLLGDNSVLSTTVGGTTFRWRDGNTIAATELQQKVINALRETLTVWG